MSETGRRVVCIEDDPGMIELMKLVLDRKGFEFIGANGGQVGLEAMRRTEPDLVLLDLMMPEMDGWEVYRRMKADEKLDKIPVIVVTAKREDIDKILALHVAKVAGYIMKPFSPNELVRAIEQVLKDRSSSQSA